MQGRKLVILLENTPCLSLSQAGGRQMRVNESRFGVENPVQFGNTKISGSARVNLAKLSSRDNGLVLFNENLSKRCSLDKQWFIFLLNKRFDFETLLLMLGLFKKRYCSFLILT